MQSSFEYNNMKKKSKNEKENKLMEAIRFVKTIFFMNKEICQRAARCLFYIWLTGKPVHALTVQGMDVRLGLNWAKLTIHGKIWCQSSYI